MNRFGFYGMMVAAVIGFGGVVSIPSYLIQTHIEYRTIEVVDKERLLDVSSDGNGGSTSSWVNFVYTSDEVFVVKDSFWNWHFRARDVYARLTPGAECDVTLSGYRWGFFSMHQNIIEAKCEQ